MNTSAEREKTDNNWSIVLPNANRSSHSKDDHNSFTLVEGWPTFLGIILTRFKPLLYDELE